MRLSNGNGEILIQSFYPEVSAAAIQDRLREEALHSSCSVALLTKKVSSTAAIKFIENANCDSSFLGNLLHRIHWIVARLLT
jgi:hypothetical protein